MVTFKIIPKQPKDKVEIKEVSGVILGYLEYCPKHRQYLFNLGFERKAGEDELKMILDKIAELNKTL